MSAAAGVRHMIYTLSNGKAVAFGDDSHGQATVPAALGEVQFAAAGWDTSVLVLKNGTAFAFGKDDEGQATVPAIQPLRNITAVASGRKHTVFLLGDGSVVGTAPGRVPEVPPGRRVVSVAAISSGEPALGAGAGLSRWPGAPPGNESWPFAPRLEQDGDG